MEYNIHRFQSMQLKIWGAVMFVRTDVVWVNLKPINRLDL